MMTGHMHSEGGDCERFDSFIHAENDYLNPKSAILMQYFILSPRFTFGVGKLVHFLPANFGQLSPYEELICCANSATQQLYPWP